MQLQPGSLLQGGKYKIIRAIGQGGFGITYEAMQTGLERRVAVKEFFMRDFCERGGDTLHVTLGTRSARETVEHYRDKFIKEAKTIAAMEHPNIIRIHDIFEENGTAYYVMEYIGSGSLCDKGGTGEAEALRCIRQVAGALQYIHAQRIMHLDVKPSNILLRPNGNAVLIDFGISKRYDASGGQTSSTPVGISKGYAPMEQYNSGGVSTFSPTTDIYALGATFYFLLTGQQPPEANVVSEDGLPPMPASISLQTRKAIEAAMQPKRKDRPQDVAAFLSLLPQSPQAQPAPHDSPEDTLPAAQATQPQPQARPQTPVGNKTNKGKKKIYITIALAAAVAAAIVFWPGGGKPGETAEAQISYLDSIRMAQIEDSIRHAAAAAALSPQEDAATSQATEQATQEEAAPPKRYSLIGTYQDGLATAVYNGKWGFIDKDRNEVVPCKYDNTADFHDGVAGVELNGKWGLVNTKGTEITPCIYEEIILLNEKRHMAKRDGKWGFIDENGKEVIPCQYSNCYAFFDGLASVQLDGKWGSIDQYGNVVIPFAYDWIDSWFKNGKIRVRQGDDTYYIDKQGNRIGSTTATTATPAPKQYDVVFPFSEGLARVKLNGKWGFIDENRREVAPCKYDYADSHSDGLARVELNSKYGFVDKNGKEIVPCKYDEAHGFHEGLVCVKLNGKWGFIDPEGKTVIPLTYDAAGDFEGGTAQVRKGEKWFYINKQGRKVK